MSHVPRHKLDVEAAERAVALGCSKVRNELPELLTWIQDINWPVARVLWPLLLEAERLLVDPLRAVLTGDDDVWKYWCIQLIDESPPIVAELLDAELRRIATCPTPGEVTEEVDQVVRDLLARQGQTAWERLSDAEYGRAWDAFEARYGFRAGIEPASWPAIREPPHSVIYSIAHVFREGYSEADHLALYRTFITALRWCVSDGSSVYALDWQHDSYRFWPHRSFRFESEEDWPVPPIPNGDYSLFVATDMSFGLFGHPWERSVCLFGEVMVDAMAREAPAILRYPIRRGGRPVLDPGS